MSNEAKKRRFVLWFLAVILLLLMGGWATISLVEAAHEVLYVAPTPQGAGDCSAWRNACTLTQALLQAQNSDEIWMKEGTYKPDTTGLTDPRTATFLLGNGVAVYGGFAGTETSRDQRDWQAHVTVLSGDIGVADDDSDNVYHVVTILGSATMDGVTITKGRADGNDDDNQEVGGGMIVLDDGDDGVHLTNILFKQNIAEQGGGRIMCLASG